MINENIQWLNLKEAADFLGQNFPSERWYTQAILRYIRVGLQPPPFHTHGDGKRKRFLTTELLEWHDSIFDQRKLGNNRKKPS
jgi:hypothetical protein